MSNRKSFKVTEDQYKKLQFIEGASPEEKKRQRLETIKGNIRRATHFERLIVDKQDQIDTNILKEKHENYIDGVKPLFMLQNEIEEIRAQIEQLAEMNKAIQEELDKEG